MSDILGPYVVIHAIFTTYEAVVAKKLILIVLMAPFLNDVYGDDGVDAFVRLRIDVYAFSAFYLIDKRLLRHAVDFFWFFSFCGPWQCRDLGTIMLTVTVTSLRMLVDL